MEAKEYKEFDVLFTDTVPVFGQVKQFIAENFIAKSKLKEIVEELKKIEKEKWEDAEHCTCLAYAVDLVEKKYLIK